MCWHPFLPDRAVHWHRSISCWDGGGGILPLYGPLSSFSLAAWDPQPLGLPKWAPFQLQIAWLLHMSRKLPLDTPQPGLGCGSVPKGTLLKLIWLHKSRIFLFCVEGEGLGWGAGVLGGLPSDTRAHCVPCPQGYGNNTRLYTCWLMLTGN